MAKHLFITQLTEETNVNNTLINKLYNMCQRKSIGQDWFDNTSKLIGAIQTGYIYKEYADLIHEYFPQLNINPQGYYIMFEDTHVLDKLLDAGYGDGFGITQQNASSIIFKNLFNGDEELISFNHFDKFTAQQSQQCLFKNCINLTSINLSKLSGTPINEMFRNCQSLISISNLGNINKISDAMFRYCINLESITIPSSVLLIGSSAFYECKALTSIELPSSITTLDATSFYGCINLTTINLQNVTTIGNRAFEGCTSLSIDVNMPSLTSLHGGAFQNTAIKTIINLGSISEIETVNQGGVYYGAFKNCTSLTTANIPDTCTIISHCAFEGCTSLTTIIGGAYVIALGSYVFKNCSSLTSLGQIDLSKLTAINNQAFYGCTFIIQDLNCPLLTTIGNAAFYNNTGIKNISNLGNVSELPAQYQGGSWYGCFQNCKNLETVVLPNTLTQLNSNTFYGCNQLRTINIPLSVTQLKDGVFQRCTALTNAVLYFKNVEYIGNVVFELASINQLYFPNLKDMYKGYYTNWHYHSGPFSTYSSATWSCNLLYIRFDESMTIWSSTFMNLRCVYLIINNPTPLPIEQYAITGGNPGFQCTNIFVPDESVNLYKNAEIWSNLSDKYKPISEFPYIVNTYAEYEELRNNGDYNIYLIKEYMN